jgi:tetratricopeptide (TPR) repeat protein
MTEHQRHGPRVSTPAALIAEGRAHQLGGRLREAGECYALAIDTADASNDAAAVAEALRRLGVVHHLQGESGTGLHYCERSREVARASSNSDLAAEAVMALGNMACDQGRMSDARALYQAALAEAPKHPDLAARIEQNLGIVESVQGNLVQALVHYRRALHAYEASHDTLGRARAQHNIGMICADQRDWTGAESAYDQAALLANQGGDYHLSALCHLNRAEIDLAHERYEQARREAESALAIFERLGARGDMADAFRTLGTALHFLKRPTLAESRLRSALEIATSSKIPLSEAESCRDMAVVLADTGRSAEALGFVDRAIALFEQVGAVLDASQLSRRRGELLAA